MPISIQTSTGKSGNLLMLVLAGLLLMLSDQVARADDLPMTEVARLFGTNYAIGSNPTPEQAERMQAMAKQFLKTREAKYHALFEKAGKEFNVPAEVLMGMAFVQTRWVQGKTQPAGMAESFGIMALADGTSLQEAAKVTGIQTDELKRDAYQNIRGAAALLRKCHGETSKAGDDVENWCLAVVEYFNRWESPTLCCCAEDWALRIFSGINTGYHGEGIEWSGRRLDMSRINVELEALRGRRALARMRVREGHIGHTNSLTRASSVRSALPTKPD
jgi:hypothetical protein